jgi:membrane protease YdiL (CAAX protease family)
MLIAGFGVPVLVPGEAGSIMATVTLLVLVAVVARVKGRGLAEVGLNRPASWPRTFLLGVAYAVLIFLLFRITLEPALEHLTGVDRDLTRFDFLKNNLSALLNTLLMLWISAALIEEILFRGFLITNIAGIFGNRRIGWVAGVLFSSSLFALIHTYQGLSGVLLTGLAGAFFGFIFLAHHRNLWIVVLAHGFTDSSAAVMVYFDVYEKVTSWLL